MPSVTFETTTLHYGYHENFWTLRNWAQDKLNDWEQIQLYVNLAAFGAPHWTTLKVLVCVPIEKCLNIPAPELPPKFRTVYDALQGTTDRADYYPEKKFRDLFRVIPNGCDLETFRRFRPDLVPDFGGGSNVMRLAWMLPAPAWNWYTPRPMMPVHLHPQFNRFLTADERECIYNRGNWEPNVMAFLGELCKLTHAESTGNIRIQRRYDHFMHGGTFVDSTFEHKNMRTFDYSQWWPRSYESSEPYTPQIPFPVFHRKGDKYAKRVDNES